MEIQEREMPLVGQCGMLECIYNRDSFCHARAISIDNGSQPCCDSFCQSSLHSDTQRIALVNACRVSACKYNQDGNCQADLIQIEPGECPAACITFCKRRLDKQSDTDLRPEK